MRARPVSGTSLIELDGVHAAFATAVERQRSPPDIDPAAGSRSLPDAAILESTARYKTEEPALPSVRRA
jgi:hypothetical protein